jgi:hypothetical protein
VPVGRGKRFGANMSKWVDAIAGGWSLAMTGRVENGRLVDIGDLKLVNMTLKDVQKMYHYYRASDGFYYMLPQDVIDNSVKAATLGTTSVDGFSTTIGPPDPKSPHFEVPDSVNCIDLNNGDCGTPRQQFITAPVFTRFDMSLKKTFPLGGRRNFQMQVDVLNMFNAIDFNANTTFLSSTKSNYRVTSAYQDIVNTFDPGGRLAQLIFRVNW